MQERKVGGLHRWIWETVQFSDIPWISLLTFTTSFSLPLHQRHLCPQFSHELKSETMYYYISENESQVAKAIDSATVQFASENWSHRKGGWTSTSLDNLLLNFCQFFGLDFTRCQP